MNNLKFRAYEEGVMFYQNDNTSFNVGGPHGNEMLLWLGFNMIQNNLLTNPLMQYTGIKDINGNEIYTGDIVSLVYRNSWDTEDQFESPEAVEFGECDASIQGAICGVPMLAFNLGGYPITTDDKYKIVGNIYENKDLINHQ